MYIYIYIQYLEISLTVSSKNCGHLWDFPMSFQAKKAYQSPRQVSGSRPTRQLPTEPRPSGWMDEMAKAATRMASILRCALGRKRLGGGFVCFLNTLRIIGPSYRGVWICIAGFRDLQTPSSEIPLFLGYWPSPRKKTTWLQKNQHSMANLTGNFRKKSMGDFDKGSENFERIPQGLVVFFLSSRG